MTFDDLNKRFAVISVGNKVVVMETEPDGSVRELWPFQEFERLLCKEFINVQTQTKDGVRTERKPIAKVWLTHKKGRRFDRLVYAMPGSTAVCGANDYNGYLGYRIKPAAGSWSLNRAHILDIICGGRRDYYDWVINWLAALVQFPGRHAMTAIVLRGDQGTGKGHLADKMIGGLFYSQQYIHILGSNQLTGQFNEHLSGKVLIFADESTWGGDPRAADKLKGMVTEDTIPIERKFLKTVEEPSALHIIIASNNEWPVTIAPDDRRFMVLEVSDARRQDTAYFAALHEELRNGGHAAMLHDLLAHTVDQSALRHPPQSEGKREMTVRSFSPLQQWWHQKLEHGQLLPLIEDWPKAVAKKELHDDYLEFLNRHHRDGRTHRATETELGTFLRKHVPQIGQTRPNGDDGLERQRVWLLPTLQACRAAWLTALRWPTDHVWEVEDEAEQQELPEIGIKAAERRNGHAIVSLPPLTITVADLDQPGWTQTGQVGPVGHDLVRQLLAPSNRPTSPTKY